MSIHKSMLMGGWVPLPQAIEKATGWPEGQRLKLEVVAGVLVVEAATDDEWGALPNAQTPKPKPTNKGAPK